MRRFNRFYTRQMGLLHEYLLDSEFSLTEVRILFELAQRPALATADLCRELGLDAGYLSRVVGGFEKKGLVTKSRSTVDGRIATLQLTGHGVATIVPLSDASRLEIIAMLEPLSVPEQVQLVDAMAQVEQLLDAGAQPPAPYLLRDPQAGDIGWVVHRHGVLYAQEYGWNQEFEALVAEIAAQYIRDFDPVSDHGWIAEKAGKIVGSVFVVRHDAVSAKIRLLYVEPGARGLGIGKTLVAECVRFARLAGYEKLILGTNNVQQEARRNYERAGFQLIEQHATHSYGKDLIAETWSLDL
ncbi:bifunctional helix-turn-helix transcriptional regulator/GNAT family N-acetyltransferase [Janthinobacterium agaricidamnosum]|uniref:MarR family protein n=1 Tax=Janthinobacterium agaricidamnosum NBRC 102515 = DSM 9628 TaxID=1349767 RepID=W0VA52_9BURK|nr:helix-turn-helix domain-containing GNAT family N-acetyltransferase [Janthinobacterium agaricidamnosum]CDG84450.1 marR family protein [Janthinobacterium agaricidamnosum NBRC 102515 = DSM 9628]